MATKRKLPVLPVGLFLLFGGIALGYMIIKYGGSSKAIEGYTINVVFDDASGIIKGGVVRLSGTDVGFVSDDPMLNSANKVSVPITLEETLSIPSNSTIKIVSLSLLGDKAIFIQIPQEQSSTQLKEGDSLFGKSPKGFEQLQNQAENLTTDLTEVLDKTKVSLDALDTALNKYSIVADQLNESLDRINTSILTDETIADVKRTISNVKNASESFEEVAVSLKPLAEDLKPLAKDTRQTLAEFKQVASTTNDTVKKLDEKIDKLDPVINALPKTLDTYTKIGESLDQAINSDNNLLSAVTRDKEVKDDAKSFVKNLRTNGILGYKDDSDPDADDPRDRYRGSRR